MNNELRERIARAIDPLHAQFDHAGQANTYRMADAVLAALAPELGRVPDGWVVVPRELTPAMHRAMNERPLVDDRVCSEVWADVLAAAPEVPNE